MGLQLAGVKLAGSGVASAMDYLVKHVAKPKLKVAA
jgi:alanine-glyoxylate transaminase/serine-glyoxylate transaminase/serine-pyruvate transaminase